MKLNNTSGIILIVLIAFSICSCANLAPIKPDLTATDFQDKSIATTKRPDPLFSIRTLPTTLTQAILRRHTSPLTGVIIYTTAEFADGKKVAKDYGISDPAIDIVSPILGDLITKYGLTKEPSSPEITGLLKQQISEYNGSDYLLDVQTNIFTLSIRGFNPQLGLHVRFVANLIEVDTQNSIARSACLYDTDRKTTNYSRKEMLENNAKILKEEIQQAVDECVDKIRNEWKLL